MDADSFDIIATNGAGQIQTSASLNHEEKASYSVAVRARDGRGGTDAVNVTIRVTDVDKRGAGHAVRAGGDGAIEHELAGELGRAGEHRPAHHRLRLPVPGTDGLRVDRGHEHDDPGHDGHDRGTDPEHVLRRGGAREERRGYASDWSNPGNGVTNEPGANNPPVFTEGTSATRSVSADVAFGHAHRRTGGGHGRGYRMTR